LYTGLCFGRCGSQKEAANALHLASHRRASTPGKSLRLQADTVQIDRKVRSERVAVLQAEELGGATLVLRINQKVTKRQKADAAKIGKRLKLLETLGKRSGDLALVSKNWLFFLNSRLKSIVNWRD